MRPTLRVRWPDDVNTDSGVHLKWISYPLIRFMSSSYRLMSQALPPGETVMQSSTNRNKRSDRLQLFASTTQQKLRFSLMFKTGERRWTLGFSWASPPLIFCFTLVIPLSCISDLTYGCYVLHTCTAHVALAPKLCGTWEKTRRGPYKVVHRRI